MENIAEEHHNVCSSPKN